MEHATINHDSFANKIHLYPARNLVCECCGQPWSSNYADYAGMQDLDFIICSCGEQVCQVNELKNT